MAKSYEDKIQDSIERKYENCFEDELTIEECKFLANFDLYWYVSEIYKEAVKTLIKKKKKRDKRLNRQFKLLQKKDKKKEKKDIIDLVFAMTYYHSDLLYELMSDDDKINEYCESKFVQKLCEEYVKGDWDNEDISLADSIKIFLEHKLKEAEDNG